MVYMAVKRKTRGAKSSIFSKNAKPSRKATSASTPVRHRPLRRYFTCR
jgi:hypothetical protein